MDKKDFDYRFNLKDKKGIKAGIIGLILCYWYILDKQSTKIFCNLLFANNTLV